jgi:transcriptional regulator with XRE-family HTH domain
MPTDTDANEVEARIRARQGALIRQQRLAQGRTMLWLATETENTEGSVYAWESGKSTPRLYTQLRIADVLGVEWADLFSVDEQLAAQ